MQNLIPLFVSQVGIGTPISPENAIKWYKLAAENGDKRAANRLQNFSKAGVNTSSSGGSATREELLATAAAADGDSADSNGKRDKDCVVM